MSPLANASTTLVGMTLSRKSVMLCDWPALRVLRDGAGVERAGSMFMPAPGFTTLTTTSPMMSASVLTTSK